MMEILCIYLFLSDCLVHTFRRASPVDQLYCSLVPHAEIRIRSSHPQSADQKLWHFSNADNILKKKFISIFSVCNCRPMYSFFLCVYFRMNRKSIIGDLMCWWSWICWIRILPLEYKKRQTEEEFQFKFTIDF